MLRRENILITEDYMSKTTSATHFTAPGEIECFDSSIHFGKESDRVEIQNCNIKTNVLVHCSKDDTYDFETGALIALMKMCGVEKVKKAAKETFFDVAENSVNEYEEKIHALEEEKEQIIVAKNVLYNKLKEENEKLNYEYNLVKAGHDYWKEQYKELKESDKYAKSEVGRLSLEKHRLEEENEKLKLDCERLQHEYDLCKNSENALKCSVDYLNKSIAKLNTALYSYKNDLYKVAKRCRELEAKEDILNKQEETINKREEEMSVYFGGRGCGKQHKALVELFKKTDQKKVDAAYKEAYNTTLPLWQKEVLNQMYGVYKESKEKIELPRTLDINGTVYRKTIQIKDFGKEIKPLHNDQLDSLIEESRAFTRKCVHEWLYGPPTKREEMWAEIFALHKENDVCIKVKKEDVNTFLHEIENKIPEITWLSTVKIFETKYTITDIYEALKTCDTIYFRLHKANKLTYSPDPYPYRELKSIDYLPPMRWDLFKKGRIAVKVTYDNYKEFCDACERELGKKPSTYLWDNVAISICKKDGCFEIFTIEHQKKTGRKIVNWEDVR